MVKTVWATITGAGTTTATKFHGDVMNKINNMFEGNDPSDTVTIHANATWTFNSVVTLAAAPVIQDNIKLSLGTGSDSTLVDTGSLVILDYDEANVGSRSFDIQSDATSILLLNDTLATLSVPLDVPDVETATVSARDGTLGITLADSTGVATFNAAIASPTLTTPVLGTPSSGVATNLTGLPLTTGVTGTLPVANGGTGVTTSTGTGNTVLSTSPTLVTPVLGTPASGVLDNCTIAANGLTYDINAQTGTTYTFVLADAGDIVTSSNASAVTMTIPPNSSVVYPIGSSITVISIGAGLTSFAQGAGVTITSTGAVSTAPVLRAQHSSATAIKTATDTWRVVGDIS